MILLVRSSFIMWAEPYEVGALKEINFFARHHHHQRQRLKIRFAVSRAHNGCLIVSGSAKGVKILAYPSIAVDRTAGGCNSHFKNTDFSTMVGMISRWRQATEGPICQIRVFCLKTAASMKKQAEETAESSMVPGFLAPALYCSSERDKTAGRSGSWTKTAIEFPRESHY